MLCVRVCVIDFIRLLLLLASCAYYMSALLVLVVLVFVFSSRSDCVHAVLYTLCLFVALARTRIDVSAVYPVSRRWPLSRPPARNSLRRTLQIHRCWPPIRRSVPYHLLCSSQHTCFYSQPPVFQPSRSLSLLSLCSLLAATTSARSRSHAAFPKLHIACCCCILCHELLYAQHSRLPQQSAERHVLRWPQVLSVERECATVPLTRTQMSTAVRLCRHFSLMGGGRQLRALRVVLLYYYTIRSWNCWNWNAAPAGVPSSSQAPSPKSLVPSPFALCLCLCLLCRRLTLVTRFHVVLAFAFPARRADSAPATHFFTTGMFHV